MYIGIVNHQRQHARKTDWKLDARGGGGGVGAFKFTTFVDESVGKVLVGINASTFFPPFKSDKDTHTRAKKFILLFFCSNVKKKRKNNFKITKFFHPIYTWESSRSCTSIYIVHRAKGSIRDLSAAAEGTFYSSRRQNVGRARKSAYIASIPRNLFVRIHIILMDEFRVLSLYPAVLCGCWHKCAQELKSYVYICIYMCIPRGDESPTHTRKCTSAGIYDASRERRNWLSTLAQRYIQIFFYYDYYYFFLKDKNTSGLCGTLSNFPCTSTAVRLVMYVR